MADLVSMAEGWADLGKSRGGVALFNPQTGALRIAAAAKDGAEFVDDGRFGFHDDEKSARAALKLEG
jgi:hypothetical protein